MIGMYEEIGTFKEATPTLQAVHKSKNLLLGSRMIKLSRLHTTCTESDRLHRVTLFLHEHTSNAKCLRVTVPH
jgi:hypothetical protein